MDKFPSPVQRSKSNVIVIRCFKDKVGGGGGGGGWNA